MTILFALALNLFAPAPVQDSDMIFAASCTDQPGAPFHSLTGPGQMAVVLGTPRTTTVLFEDFIDGNGVIALHSPEA